MRVTGAAWLAAAVAKAVMIMVVVVEVGGEETNTYHTHYHHPPLPNTDIQHQQEFSDEPQHGNENVSDDLEQSRMLHTDSSPNNPRVGGEGDVPVSGGSRQPASRASRQQGLGSGGGGGRRRYGGRGLRQGGDGRHRTGGRRVQQESGGGDGGDRWTTGNNNDNDNMNNNNNRNTGTSLDTDITQSHSNAMIMLLQRLGERLTGIEVLQRQQTEKITTISYRLTKLELQAEERKSVTNEIGNAVRHRMETTDSQLDQVNEQLDDIKTSIAGLRRQYNDLKTAMAEIHVEKNERGSEVSGLKMQAMMGAVQEVKTTTGEVQDTMEQLSKNFTTLSKIASNLTFIADTMVTKQYLYENLNELRSQNSAVPLLAKMVMTSPPRRGSSRKASGEPDDCWQLMKQGKTRSGVYSIQPRYSPMPFFVYCDMETDGGGWTVIQRREDGTVDFLREWSDYKHGFGNVAGEYWLGNEKIHLLTNQRVSVLRVDVADFDQQVGHALYSAFAIGSEQEAYSLKILGEYTGDAGDSLRYHAGRRFSTVDVDNDGWPDRSCARDHMGAWWYHACETSNLNGRYLHGPVPPERQYTGLYWYDFRGPQYSLWRSRMMIRRGGKVDRPVFKEFTDVRNQTARLTAEQEEKQEQETQAAEETKATTSSRDDFDPNEDPYVTFEFPDA